jgi:hypothetical protein
MSAILPNQNHGGPVVELESFPRHGSSPTETANEATFSEGPAGSNMTAELNDAEVQRSVNAYHSRVCQAAEQQSAASSARATEPIPGSAPKKTRGSASAEIASLPVQPEPPKTLEEWMRRDLRASWLHDSTIEAMGCKAMTPAEIAQYCRYSPDHPALSKIGGYLIPYAGQVRTDGEVYGRVKQFDADRKYLTPTGEDYGIYFPPGYHALRGSPVLFITEGEKKATCLVQAGLRAIGVGGVGCWADKGYREQEKDQGLSLSRHTRVHEAIRAEALTAIHIIVIGDSDLNESGKQGALSSLVQLRNALRQMMDGVLNSRIADLTYDLVEQPRNVRVESCILPPPLRVHRDANGKPIIDEAMPELGRKVQLAATLGKHGADDFYGFLLADVKSRESMDDATPEKLHRVASRELRNYIESLAASEWLGHDEGAATAVANASQRTSAYRDSGDWYHADPFTHIWSKDKKGLVFAMSAELGADMEDMAHVIKALSHTLYHELNGINKDLIPREVKAAVARLERAQKALHSLATNFRNTKPTRLVLAQQTRKSI